MKYIELYGGIGGFRRGIEQAGKKWKCIWYCDSNKYTTLVFNRNFNERYKPTDIRSVDVKDIPNHDFLCAGFPCQPFSLAGKRRGFDDTRGTLFFEIVKILREKRPKYFLLENVEGLLSHDKGRTFNTIVSLLGKTVNKQSFLHETEDCLNYDIFWAVLNSKKFGVPQSRPRVFIMGFRENIEVNEFSFPKDINIEVSLSDILEEEVDEKYYLSEKMQQRFREYIKEKGMEVVDRGEINFVGSCAEKPRLERDWNKSRGHREGYRVHDPKGISPSLRAKQGGASKGSQIIYTKERKEIRKHKTIDEVPTLKTRMGTGGGNVPMIARCLDAHMDKGIMPENFFEKGERNIIFDVYNQQFRKDKIAGSLKGEGISETSIGTSILRGMRLRRLTPTECERLQGFPDSWTEEGIDENGKVHKISDSQRYKMLGNAVTTNVIEAITNKLEMI